MDEVFRYARAVPEDRVEWMPAESARSVLAQCKELAKCADWSVEVLETGTLSFEPDPASEAEQGALKTVADCERLAREKLDRFYEFARTYPDEKMMATTDLPFGPGGAMRTLTMAEMMRYPRWNAVYHLGQIAYIQTLYGDREMH